MTKDLISRAAAIAILEDEMPEHYLSKKTQIVAKLRAMPAYEVGVRELEWVKHPSKGIWRAKTGFGEYKVFGLLPAATWDFDSWSDANDKISASSGAPDAAKAAAQADHAARIRSALTAAPVADVAEAAIMVADAIDADMLAFNALAQGFEAHPDMLGRHFFSKALRHYAAAIDRKKEANA